MIYNFRQFSAGAATKNKECRIIESIQFERIADKGEDVSQKEQEADAKPKKTARSYDSDEKSKSPESTVLFTTELRLDQRTSSVISTGSLHQQ